MKSVGYRNGSGYPDPTAFEGMNAVVKEECELEHKKNKLIQTIKNVVSMAGFEVVGRIEVKHKDTGKVFK